MEIIHKRESTDIQEAEFNRLLDGRPFNRRPVVIYFDKNEPSPHHKLQMIEDYLQQQKISPQFPYPVYVVSEQDISSERVRVIRDESEIPKYFQVLKENLKPSESLDFHKINMLTTKISNAPIAERLQLIVETRAETKKLFMISREAQYYEDLLMLIKQSHGEHQL